MDVVIVNRISLSSPVALLFIDFLFSGLRCFQEDKSMIGRFKWEQIIFAALKVHYSISVLIIVSINRRVELNWNKCRRFLVCWRRKLLSVASLLLLFGNLLSSRMKEWVDGDNNLTSFVDRQSSRRQTSPFKGPLWRQRMEIPHTNWQLHLRSDSVPIEFRLTRNWNGSLNPET